MQGERIVKIAERGGPYDVAIEELRQKFGAEACLLIVLSGSEGTGFSASMPDDLKHHLPALFRNIAKEVEEALAAEQGAMFCPVCSTALVFEPRYAGHPNKPPMPGALTVCAHCASFLTLGEPALWRLLTEDELLEMPDAVRLQLTRSRRNIERRRI